MKSKSLNIVFTSLLALPLTIASCSTTEQPDAAPKTQGGTPVETPEWFQLRPEVEKAYGYTHAVRVGDVITISGAVSMDDEGIPTAVGDLAQQMKNCYSDLDKVLKHYGSMLIGMGSFWKIPWLDEQQRALFHCIGS